MLTLTIYGESNSGKTTTCHILLELLIEAGAEKVIYDKVDESDFQAIIHFNGIIIAIYSAGDGKFFISKGVEFAFESKCRIFINTVSKRSWYGDSLRELYDGIEWNQHFRHIETFDESHRQKQIDEALARQLLDEIMTELNKL